MDYTKEEVGKSYIVICPLCQFPGKLMINNDERCLIVHTSHRDQGFEIYDNICEFTPDNFIMCEDCYGTGEVEIWATMTRTGYIETEEVKCEYCAGAGWFRRNDELGIN